MEIGGRGILAGVSFEELLVVIARPEIAEAGLVQEEVEVRRVDRVKVLGGI